MRKNILFILIILLFFSGIYIRVDNKKDEGTEFIKYDNNIYIDETVNRKDVDKIYYYLDLIPEWILKEYDGNILLTDDEVNMIVGSDLKMTGAFDINSHNIFLNINDMSSILHEMGHFYYRTILTDKSELSDLFKNEGKDFHPHYKSNENEFFAECFRRTLLEDKNFINNSPESYRYILKTIQGP